MNTALARVVGVPGAVLMGLGSILGTGIFVSVGIAAGVAGSSVVLAAALAAVVATFNGLSSAQLAAAHPVSGGTYEYGYKFLRPLAGFSAGWMFLCAKSASAATAALGFAGYLYPAQKSVIAAATVAVLTAIVAGGMKRSNRTNTVIVTCTLIALGAFVITGAPRVSLDRFTPFFGEPRALLEATALMFVAYTGYGRIATLGEEVEDPRRNIPRAVVLALLVTMLLYLAVVFTAIGAVGAARFAESAAPLVAVARELDAPWTARLVSIGAATAMLGVLLNLVLGLSRVYLAMARRGDMPARLAKVDGGSPTSAVWVTGLVIFGLVLLGNVKTTWSFSAFTVLVYYAITNWAALKLPREMRRFPRWISAAGLISCAGLAFWVQPVIWLAGLAIAAVGLLWFWLRRGARAQRTGPIE